MAFNFKDRYNEENYTGTLIVDALNLAFRWKHTPKYNTFRYEFEKTVASIANSYKCGKTIITADWGHSAFRRELYPEYKADRKERFKDQTDEERAQFEEFFAEYESTLELMSNGNVVLRYKNVEADDIAAHLVLNKDRYGLNDIWLLSSDDDWSLLVQEGVNRFSWRTRKEITADNWFEHYGVTQEELISLKCLMGDKSDNIPGVPGIGPKRAETLIKEYGSALDIHDLIPIQSKYKYIQDLNENKEQILTNYELMDLLTYCDDAIGEENLQDIRLKMGDVSW